MVAVAPVAGRTATGLRHHGFVAQLLRYAVVGGLGTLANALIFLVLRTWWDPIPANLLALVLSTAISTEVNRRFTFGGSAMHHWRAHVQNGGTVVFYAFYSSTVLLLLAAVIDSPAAWQESLAVAVASVAGGLARFLVLRYWVFGERHPASREGQESHFHAMTLQESGFPDHRPQAGTPGTR